MKRFTLLPSRIHFLATLLVHICVLILVVVSTLALWLKLCACAFCLLSYVVAERARTRNAYFPTLLFDGSSFLLINEVGKEEPIILREGLWSTPWLMALPFRFHTPPHKKGVLLLFRDSLDAEQWRQMRVLLRTQQHIINETR